MPGLLCYSGIVIDELYAGFTLKKKSLCSEMGFFNCWKAALVFPPRQDLDQFMSLKGDLHRFHKQVEEQKVTI